MNPRATRPERANHLNPRLRATALPPSWACCTGSGVAAISGRPPDMSPRGGRLSTVDRGHVGVAVAGRATGGCCLVDPRQVLLGEIDVGGGDVLVEVLDARGA